MGEKRPGVGVGVVLVRDSKVLLGKRHDDAEKASSEMRGEGTWTLPGGKLDFGESFEDCARREVLEETGMLVKKLRVISLTNDRIPAAHFATVGLLAEEFEGEPGVMEPDEITEWRWFSLDSLPSPMFRPSEKMMRNFIGGVFYGD